jgi:alpha-beta hydrolase superfamily lysophospholipase
MARHEEDFFYARDHLRLFWEADTPDQPKAYIGVVHGYADHCGRYRGVIGHLVSQGFAVHAFDYRGHGQADGRRGHCDSFSEYIDDLNLFWERLHSAAGSKKVFLLAHSHGGLIAILWLKNQPKDLAGLLLSAPYLKLGFEPPTIKVVAAKMVEKIIPWFPFKNELTFDQLSTDPEVQKATERDPLYNRTVTPRWFSQSMLAQQEASNGGQWLRQPALVFLGSDDTVASVAATKAFYGTIASADKTYKEYPGMRHETMNDLRRDEVWKDISNWISNRV